MTTPVYAHAPHKYSLSLTFKSEYTSGVIGYIVSRLDVQTNTDASGIEFLTLASGRQLSVYEAVDQALRLNPFGLTWKCPDPVADT